MPTYEYQCDACGHEFEAFQSMKDDALTVCPECQKKSLRRLISGGVGIIFKGSGFYVNDSRGAGSSASPASPASPAAPSSSSSSSASESSGSGAAGSGSTGSDSTAPQSGKKNGKKHEKSEKGSPKNGVKKTA